MEIVRPHPPRAPRAQLAILMTALIVLVAGYGASKTSAFQWFLLNASLRMQFPQSGWITTRELPDSPMCGVSTVRFFNGQTNTALWFETVIRSHASILTPNFGDGCCRMTSEHLYN